ncbi:MAG TPA: RICIN domain-containing protein [Candidatus Butyricicoccus stercorigallinarum]|nr:RICIN domain-containing protein [Candidatus Butyricicoccus stercorigallinarum]
MNFHLREHKKRILSAVLCGSMMLPAGAQAMAFDTRTIFDSVFASASSSSTADLSDCGYALQRLGLVAGGEDGDLMLENTGSRAEALTLFISLLGERSAVDVGYSFTFRDIPRWFENFAGYGVYRGYTSGYSATQFGSGDTVTPEAYTTFVLGALGYSSEDFNWEQSLDKAVEIGLCSVELAEKWKNNTFRRQEIMEISYLALSTNLKDSDCTLADKLIAMGIITAEQAEEEGLTFGETYTVASENQQTDLSGYTALPAGNYELHNIASGDAMTANPISRQSDLYVTGDVNSSTQLFRIEQNSDGSFRILSASKNELAVDVNPTSGADAILWTANGTDCQDFVARNLSDGTYEILLKANPDMALTVVDGDVRLSEYTGGTEQQWKLSDNSEDTAAATAKLKSIMEIYPSGTSLGSGYSFGGASQCMGFGREVFYRMFGQTAKWSYDGSPKSAADGKLFTKTASSTSYSASSIKALISKAKPGDILQMDSPKMHTMVFVSSDSEGFTVYDANWTGPNEVSVRYVKYGAWASRNSNGICVLHATNYPTT